MLIFQPKSFSGVDFCASSHYMFLLGDFEKSHLYTASIAALGQMLTDMYSQVEAVLLPSFTELTFLILMQSR